MLSLLLFVGLVQSFGVCLEERSLQSMSVTALNPQSPVSLGLWYPSSQLGVGVQWQMWWNLTLPYCPEALRSDGHPTRETRGHTCIDIVKFAIIEHSWTLQLACSKLTGKKGSLMTLLKKNFALLMLPPSPWKESKSALREAIVRGTTGPRVDGLRATSELCNVAPETTATTYQCS